MADQFKVNSADYTSAADALAAAVPDASGNISITAINGDLTLDSSVAATGKVILRVASADALIAGEDVSSTITITSDFASKLDMQVGTDSENENLQGCTGENAPYRIIFDGANVTGAAGFYSYNYGCVELKNGAQYLGAGSDSHVRGSVLVTGEGTLLSAAFLSVYAADFGSTKPYAASMVVKDGATLFATTDRTDANTFKIGHASKAYRGGELIIEGGIVKSNTDIVVNAGGTISLSNSTVNGKVNYGQIILTEKYASKLVTTNAAAGAVTISLKSTDYANCDASYKIIDIQNTTALDLSKVTITLDGAAYTLGTTFADCYSINQVDNDLVLTYAPPPVVIVSLGDTEIGGYQKMSEALQAIKNVDTGNDGPYTITLNGTATETASGTKYIENDIVLTGKGTVNYNGECWFGNGNAINITVDEGDITFNSSVINGRHNGSSAASQLTISNGRLQHTGGYTTVNGTTRISGYGSTAVTDADGNVMYGYKLEDDSYVANFSTTKFHIADRYYENNGLALELKDFAYLHLGGADSAKGDTVIWKNEKGTSSAAQSFTAVIENSKLVAGNFEFNTAAHVLNISGQSVISVLNFGFKDTTDTTVCSGTATVNVTGMDSEISLGQISSAVTAINYTLELADFASAGMIEAGDNVELLTLNNADAALDAATVLSITLDGAAYTLGDEIVDDAGNKYVINMGDANGDSAANDLLVTLTEKAPEPVVPEDPVLPEDGESGGATSEPSQKVYINPNYNENTLGYFSDVVGEELVLGKNAFTSVAEAKKALGANADIEYCTSDWNNDFTGSKQLEGIAQITNNSNSMTFKFGEMVSLYDMANGVLNLNKVTADTDFENFSMVNVNGSKLSGAIENNSFSFFGTGDPENATGTAWLSPGGAVNISGSTVSEVNGYAFATLNKSNVEELSNDDILSADVKLENGEITAVSNVVKMVNGTAQLTDSTVGLLENYANAALINSEVQDAVNVNSLQALGGSNRVESFISSGAFSSIINSFGSTLELGDVTMNGGFDMIANCGGTLILSGDLKGVEMLFGSGDLVASDEQIKQLGGAEKVKATYFGDIIDLGNTAAGFRGKAAELADNTKANAMLWDVAGTEGNLEGWLGIGSDVDVKDSVDYVKFTADANGTLDITSSAWSSSTGDKVSVDGTALTFTDGSFSFGVTAGTEYLVKIERKDNNSMSYDMTLA